MTTERTGTDIDAVIRRVRWRSLALGASAALLAFLVGWRAGVSLTISAAVVIFSFLAFEKLTERLVRRQSRSTLRRLVPLLFVTVGSLVLLTVVLLRWRGFDPVAGALGLSVVVAAVVPELWMGKER